MNVAEPSVRYSPHGKGYVLLWKKALTSTVFQDANLWKVFTWCLLRANFQPKPLLIEREEVFLKVGEFVTGRHSAKEELNMSESMIYRSLKTLQKLNVITLKSNNRFTVVSICNYESYQDFNFQVEQPVNNGRTTSEQPVNTEEEVKEKKEVKEKSITKSRPQSVDSILEYGIEIGLDRTDCEAFFDHYESNGWKIGGKAPMKDWQSALRNWKRNKDKYKGVANAITSNGVRKSDQTARATYEKSTEQIAQDVRNTAESIRLLRRERS